MTRPALLFLTLTACPGPAPGEASTDFDATSLAASTSTDQSSGTSPSSETTASPTTGECHPITDASTTSTTSTSTTSTSTMTTGSAGLELQTALITADNRHHVEMHGGWGPHLRGLMRADDDALWFTVDAGEDVLHNREVVYMRRGQGEPAWSEVARAEHTPGVQQNAASILLGGVVYTYAVDIAARWLTECTLQVADPRQHACEAVQISGHTYMTPASSNYVGAAVLGPSARIVWWTVVGEDGAPGAMLYTYNFGGGWNGPVVSSLGAANDIGYVHAMRTPAGGLSLAGQAFTGKYPDGTYSALVADLVPGEPLAFTALASGDPQVTAQSAADLWHDPDSGAVHVLVDRSDGGLAYYHRPPAAAWAAHVEPLHVFSDTYRARFLRPVGEPLHVLRGSYSGDGVVLLRAGTVDGAAAIDWTDVEQIVVPMSAPGLGAPSGLYVESDTYQLAPVPVINFAMCGQYQISDGQIWHGWLG